ncbi:hypothetical protein CDV36_010709 [Fusarium kuroshium]|uniref:Uncharacterized protein n=3 Tax=Fusarium solani species complex TaxID=232080 RepID=A0A3M2RWN7_9HYPO|nr:hypothetical protein CDV36_010709 [Fusarium kuroshium]RSM04115.1 hypothetical protein CDV31_010168 [Fusarium ambrosium]RSM13674.1 hypothetical protein CEP52_001829 [Fusarium oligoseptatum]
MAKNIPERYLPQYAKEDDWDDQELQDFVTSFYRLSDNPEENQRWVDSFTEDANVQIGADKAQGSEEIPDFRTRMWAHIQERKHTVLKVFPGKFTGSDASERECMLLGEASFLTRDGRTIEAGWSAHAVVRRVQGQWKFAQYRVWVQNE